MFQSLLNLSFDSDPEELFSLAENEYAVNNIEQALDLYKQAANMNYAPALYKLGLILIEIGSKDLIIAKGLEFLNKAAELNNPDANYKLSCMYKEGKLLKKDLQIASTYLIKAANLGELSAIYELALLYETGMETINIGKNLDVAFKLFSLAAESGYPQAQNKLGLFYYHKNDYTKASDWFSEAAKQGLSVAQSNLGILLLKQKNYAEAANWFLRASLKKHPEAEYRLGLMLESQFIKLNKDSLPEIWYKRAAAQEHVQAQYKMGSFYENGNSTIDRNLSIAFDWYMKAAKQEHAGAQYKVGLFYEKGTSNLKANFKEAANWYTKAATQAHKQAQYKLVELYEKDTEDSKTNDKLAFSWCEKAAEQNHIGAIYKLAYFYEKGFGIAKNIAFARYWYQKAFILGDRKAKKALSELPSLDASQQSQVNKALRIAIANKNYKETLLQIKGGADINNLNADNQNPITLAYKYKVWNILELLLLEQQSISMEKIEEALLNCKKNYEPGFKFRKQRRDSLDKAVNSFVANPLFDIDIPDLFDTVSNKYIAHLRSREVVETTSASNITSSKSASGQLGFFITSGTKLTGWLPEYFLPMRIRIFFEILLKIEMDLIDDLPCAKETLAQLLKTEILLMLEVLAVRINAKIINLAPETEKASLVEAQARNIVNRIQMLEEGQEYIIHSGFVGHTLYVNFKRQAENIIVRIDNLGAGCLKHKVMQKPSKKTSAAIQQNYRQPYLIGFVPREEFKSDNKVFNYIVDLLKAQFQEKDIALGKIYSNEFQNASQISLAVWPYKKQQLVGNCVVINKQIGLHLRLDICIEGKYLRGDEDGKPLLYDWLRANEEALVSESNAHRRRPNMYTESVTEKIAEITDTLHTSELRENPLTTRNSIPDAFWRNTIITENIISPQILRVAQHEPEAKVLDLS